MGRANHAAAAASATDGGVTLVDDALEAGEDARTHLISYDGTRDEAVVSVHGSGAFPLIENLAKELDAKDEIEYGGQFKRQSVSTVDVSVGILLVSSLNVLIQVYKYIWEREDSNIGIRQVDNEIL